MVLVPLLDANICVLPVHQAASVPALGTQMQQVVHLGSAAKAGGPTGDTSMGTSLVTEHNRAI